MNDTLSDEEMYDGGFGRLYSDDIEQEILSVVSCGGVNCLASVTESQRYAVQGKVLWPGATTLAQLVANGAFPNLEILRHFNNKHVICNWCTALYQLNNCELEVNTESVPDTEHVTDASIQWEQADLDLIFKVTKKKCENDVAKVCELGAGCGLAGFACAAREGKPVTLLTDVDLDVVALLQRNIKEFCSDEMNVGAAPLDWKNDVPVEMKEQFDLVLGADVAHRSMFYNDLCRTAANLLKKGGLFVMSNGIYRCDDGLLIDAAKHWNFNVLLHSKFPYLGVTLFVLEKV